MLVWIGVVVPLVAAQDEYGAIAEVEPVEVGETELEAEEIDDLPVLGDPFRAVHALPGTIPLQSVSPFVAVRGAPPSATVYYYDDIPLPAIAHVGAGPGLLHPSMVDELEFNPGVAPARYGRFTGAVISATAREASTEPFGEAELRLLDVGGVVDLPLGDHRVQASAHIGYPGLVYQLAVPETNVQYHDYFLRYEYRFDSRVRSGDVADAQRVELRALGETRDEAERDMDVLRNVSVRALSKRCGAPGTCEFPGRRRGGSRLRTPQSRSRWSTRCR